MRLSIPAASAMAPPAVSFVGSLTDTAKVTRSAGHRVRRIEETCQAAEQRLGPLGITRIADITGLDNLGIPVFNSVRPAAADGNLTVTSGKGLTPHASKASAMMEAIERYYGEPQGRSGIVNSLAELRRRELAVDPRLLILDRDVSFDQDTPIEWLPARELTRDRVVYVPANAVFVPYDGKPQLFGWSSNGLASGNSRPEATLHALLEVIERDAIAFAETTNVGVQVALGTLPASARRVVDAMQAANLRVFVREITSGLDVPTFHVTVDDTEACDAMLINGGFGCHLDPEVAVCRALTEAAQSRLSVISGAREDLSRYDTLRQAGYESLRESLSSWLADRPEVPFGVFADQSNGSVSEDITAILGKLTRAGLRLVFACDLASLERDLAVVRVIVPGLETAHIQRRRVGARLARALVGR